jgi:hypothetical protein
VLGLEPKPPPKGKAFELDAGAPKVIVVALATGQAASNPNTTTEINSFLENFLYADTISHLLA